ncbi:MAG: LuxR C-terminal-related transcriptional regulator [Chloroflexota bacterium]
MSLPILATKLYIPPLRPKAIVRERLLRRLDGNVLPNGRFAAKLTLISAPAGFGKTTLAASWLAQQEASATAWLSLDEGDNDAVRFLTYLIAAIQTAVPTIGDETLALLQAPQMPTTDVILTRLLNELAALPNGLILVLDDYHLLETPAIDPIIPFLLTHLPPTVHLVITTREDPSLPLPRLRARQQMTELRAADLRFSVEETAVFLNEVMGLTLEPSAIATLESRTEGWIAGLQMAALALQRNMQTEHEASTTQEFIQAFSGSHRYILGYLLEEVLLQQPEAIRTFLLQTALLNRLYGPLCDAVTGRQNSGQLLRQLEDDNLFLILLDDQRQWYRYHNLFADMLLARATETTSLDLRTLHLRASNWYEANTLLPEAIHHALAAEDFARAARLMAQTWDALYTSRQEATLQRWVEVLPTTVVQTNPTLSVGYGWVLLLAGDLAKAQSWMEETAVRLAMIPFDQTDTQLNSLRASLANARAFHAQAVGQVTDTITFTEEALQLVPESDPYTRGITLSLLALVYWANEELAKAQTAIRSSMTELERAGNRLLALHGAIVLADLNLVQGRLREAIGVYEQALQAATADSTSPLAGTADFHLALSNLYRQQANRKTADFHYQQALACSQRAALPDFGHTLLLAQAAQAQTAGKLDEALVILNQAEASAHVAQSAYPDLRPLSTRKAHIWIAQGRLDEAEQWASQKGLTTNDAVHYLREFDYLTLARLRLAQYRQMREPRTIHEAHKLLAQMQTAAESAGRWGSSNEILLLQALAYEAQGMVDEAMLALENAFRLAEPQGYVALFIEEGKPMTRLLQAAAKRGVAPAYVRQLHEAQAATRGQSATASITQPLVEPLSERELEVLHLLATELTGPQIADKLMISLNTMRTHTKNIYSKLGVNSRRTAVRRAQDLSLL